MFSFVQDADTVVGAPQPPPTDTAGIAMEPPMIMLPPAIPVLLRLEVCKMCIHTITHADVQAHTVLNCLADQ